MARTEPHLILICLGNPGPDYADTRHNAGFLFADYLAGRHGFGPFGPMDGTDALCADGAIAGMPALLVKPVTFMNTCGQIVAALLALHKFDENLYVIAHDDLDLALGSVKGRQKGGHGGHNGVRSLLAAAGRKDLHRVKLGVSSARKDAYESPADFLLSALEADERDALVASFPQAEQILVGQVKSFLAARSKQDRREGVAAQYVAEALQDARAALSDLRHASPYPIFLTPGQLRRAFGIVTALAKLLRKARKLAAEDDEFYERLARFIPVELRPLLPPRSASRRLFFAVDLHLTDEKIKVVELNCAVGFGHYAHLADQAIFPLLQDRIAGLERASRADFALFLYEQGLKPIHDPDAGALAFLRGPNNEDMFNVDELEGVAHRIEQAGGPQVVFCHEKDLELRKAGLHLSDGHRVDLIYVEENLAEWAGLAGDSPLVAAVRNGVVQTFPTLDTFLYTNKGFLALLSNPEVQQRLAPDDAESKVLRQNILWSHALDADIEPAAYYMLDQGLPLVIKDALGGGGRGVTILRPDSSSQQTGHILRQRLRGGHGVVQGYFAPGCWTRDSDLNFDLRILVAAHEGDITIGPVYGRVFRGAKLSFSDPDAGVAPVYVVT